MNKHQNEQISLSQMLNQQTQVPINIPNNTYKALLDYCRKNNVMIEAYVNIIITEAMNRNQLPKSGSVK